MNLDFSCTKCGDCCRGFRLPLSIDESQRWLEAGNAVEVLCEAIPWIEEPADSNLAALFKRERSFAASSGSLPIRVLVTLAAPLGAGCPNLSDDNECMNYDLRPRTCRTYPAEPTPFLPLVPSARRCPPEAWSPGGDSFMRNGVYSNPELVKLSRDRLTQAVRDVERHRDLCRILGISAASLANEGYVAHCPPIQDFIEALSSLPSWSATGEDDWEFVSDNADTIDAILSCEGRGFHTSDLHVATLNYLSATKKA